MAPTLVPGDCILVDKCSNGARIFDVTAALEGVEFTIYRMPGWRRYKRNDVLVFNFPYPINRDSISFDVSLYYVKRCVALPGDTFEIKNARYRVRGYDKPLGIVEAQETLMSIIKKGQARDFGIVMKGYPYNRTFNWDIANFGPLYIPAKGDHLDMDSTHVTLYKSIIEWEQKKKLTLHGDTVMLNDSMIHTYCFRENYYFVAGDLAMSSRDSRYWGLLPEPFIVGRATRIWKSVDKIKDKIRWNRTFKKIE